MENLQEANVLVTGACGFLGGYVTRALEKAGAIVISISRRTGFDLTNEADAMKAFLWRKPDIAIHLAARVGGIIANMNSPASFFYDNMRIGMNVVHAASATKTRLITVGTICSYPKDCPVPFREEDFWNGFPEPTNAPYGIAKKALLVMCQAYRKEHGLRYGYLSPTNLFGPRDNFDDVSSHVIPALIKKMVFAKRRGEEAVKCLGTGKVTRSFLYVEDAAEAIALAAAKLDYDDVVNLPGSPEISMSDLAHLIARIVGYSGDIVWDPSKPDGQPRRFIDGGRVKELLGWQPTTTLEEGLKKTINWYLGESP